MTENLEAFGQEAEYDDLLSAEEIKERKRIERQLALEQTEIDRIEQENLEHPIEEEPEAPSEKQKLQRELRAEALARLEHAARTPEDFQKVIAWWDKLDANRERKERYHEISRSGDDLPLDYGAVDDYIIFPDNLNQLILKGMNRTYDELSSEYDFKDYAFSKLRERYKVWTGNSMEEKLFDSFEIRDENGKLTNAGALLADDSPIRHSRLFCTRWNGLDKSGGMVDALDSAEYSGSLIILLNEGVGFVKRNMKTMWKKTANSRIEMPEYCERSVFEALVNALIHRDYTILGSEVHIDIYDDRLTIYSPGGMADGTRVQERDISNISSTRRNPVLADIFGRLGYMERQGSGFKKITEAYYAAHNYRAELEPKFYSDAVSFQVTLYNLNYNISAEKVAIGEENVAITPDYIAIEVAIEGMNANSGTIEKAKAVFSQMGIDGIFGRTDITAITGGSETAAGNLINKMKDAGLIEAVSGFGKGKYKFTQK